MEFRKLILSCREMAGIWRHRHLAWQLIKREVQGKYRGTWGGLAWSFLTPLLMLLVYSFVFSQIFTVRWSPAAADSPVAFALVLFSGLSIFGFVQETVSGAATLVLNHAAYVKKIVFPLEILPWVSLGSAAIHLGIALAVLLAAMLATGWMPSWTVLALPFVLLPLAIGLLGVMWLLAGLGVYLRDIRQPVTIATTGLLFLSPVFYPLDAVPERHRWLIMANPLTYFIEEGRQVLFWNAWPAAGSWLSATAIASACFACGFLAFRKLRRGFADVL